MKKGDVEYSQLRPSSSHVIIKVGAAVFLVCSVFTLTALYVQLLKQFYNGNERFELSVSELTERLQKTESELTERLQTTELELTERLQTTELELTETKSRLKETESELTETKLRVEILEGEGTTSAVSRMM